MTSGYDGTIKIDSSLDPKGFNKGVGGMDKVFKRFAVGVAAFFTVQLGVKAVKAVSKVAAEFQRLAIAAQAVGLLHGTATEETRRLVSELRDAGIQSDIANRSFIEFTRAGLDNSLLPALARGAQDLNVFADGAASSSDVLNNLILGVVKLNPLILRNAGILVDLEAAYKKAAAAQGITTQQLSSQQKQAIALDEVLTKLNGVTGLYELSQKTAAGQLSSNVRIMNEFKAAIGDTFQAAFFRLIKGFNTLVKAMTAAIAPGGALRNIFVKIGVAAAFVADIISSLFNAIARLFGVDLSTSSKKSAEVMESTGDAANNAADAQSNLADATEEAGKAAKGALASFDELNVLQQDDPSSGGGSGSPDLEDGGLGGLADLGAFDPSAITDPLEEINLKLEEFKAKAAEFFKPLSDAYYRYVKPAIDRLLSFVAPVIQWLWQEILVPFGAWIKDTLGPKVLELLGVWLDILGISLEDLGPIFKDLWDNYLKPFAIFLGEVLIIILDWLIDQLKDLRVWIKDNQTAWTIILVILFAAAAAFAIIASGIGIVGFLLAGLIYVIANAGEAWKIFTDLIKLSYEILGNLGRIAAIKLVAGFKGAFASISNFIKGVINDIIGLVNGLITRVVNGLNSVVGAANTIGGILPGSPQLSYVTAPQIPRLATGAVIPPNAQFLAMLGDQTAGRNIEAPEGLIRSIIREEIGNIEAEIDIKFNGSMSQLVQILKPEIDRENVRVGGSLVKSGVTS